MIVKKNAMTVEVIPLLISFVLLDDGDGFGFGTPDDDRSAYYGG